MTSKRKLDEGSLATYIEAVHQSKKSLMRQAVMCEDNIVWTQGPVKITFSPDEMHYAVQVICAKDGQPVALPAYWENEIYFPICEEDKKREMFKLYADILIPKLFSYLNLQENKIEKPIQTDFILELSNIKVCNTKAEHVLQEMTLALHQKGLDVVRSSFTLCFHACDNYEVRFLFDPTESDIDVFVVHVVGAESDQKDTYCDLGDEFSSLPFVSLQILEPLEAISLFSKLFDIVWDEYKSFCATNPHLWQNTQQ